MNRSNSEAERKKKVDKVITFPVPFAIGEIKQKISISTNTPSKPSREQIINKAIKLHLEGNISEAAKCYQYCINQGFNDRRVFSNYAGILHGIGNLKEAEISLRKAIKLKPDFAEAHSNLGNILSDLGNLKEAEISLRKAIELKPDFAQAHSNLGNILRDLGNLKEAELSLRKAVKLKPDFAQAHSNLGTLLTDLGNLKEAELSYRKAIEIQPDFPEAYSNLGNVLRDLGNLQEAELSYRKAVAIQPDFARAHSNLGNVLRDLGNLQEALDSYLKSIAIDPKLSNIYSTITRFLKDSDPSQLNKSKLKYILHLLLKRNDVPHKELLRAFNFLYKNIIIINLEKIDLDFSKIGLIIEDQIIVNALKKIIFCDVKLEELLTKVRKNICERIAQNIENINYSELEFIIALGEQCFLNEYVYSYTEKENRSVNNIIKKCRAGEINEKNISILSCYFPLYKLLDQISSIKSFNSSNQSFKELIKLQITEPIKEIELSKNIKKIGSISDEVSQKVKSQYEENPYPRWRYGKLATKVTLNQAINNDINPNSVNYNIGNGQLKVLIAGCGTGQHILSAQRYKNAQVTCIDLSLSSLSYAKRKMNEFEINNVELILMDILEVDLLKKRFDIIESSGVLHHMNNPLKGLKALLGILNNNGFLKLGLYSDIARQDIVKARNYIVRTNLKPTATDIRRFRKNVISGKYTEINNLQKRSDFYTLSTCRDLCFHTQEHRFTINQLRETLKSNELKFLGFLLPQHVKSLYKSNFPEDKNQTNLQNWAKFEDTHTTTFRAMYQFWVSKKGN